jgi:hypothetical protein
MGIITDRDGKVVGEFVDTLEDWKLAAEVEAGIRREFQDKLAQIASVCDDNAAPTCDAHMALKFIRQIAAG